MSRMLDSVNDGTAVAKSMLTFADYMAEWVRKNKRLKATTKAGYMRQIDAYIRPRFGRLKLQNLTESAIRKLYEDLELKGAKGKPLAPATIHRLHSLIHKALQDAYTSKPPLVRYNAATMARSAIPAAPVVNKRSVIQPWTTDEIRRFRAVADLDELAALWRVLLVLGLRRGEAAGLTWEALDLSDAAPRLTVERTRVVVEGAALVDVPKTDKGFRTIQMDTKTAQMLRAHERAQLKRQMELGPKKWKGPRAVEGRATGWVFVYMDGPYAGLPIHPDEIYERFQAVRAEAGVPRVKLHALRHMAASAMMAASKDPLTVANRLGHKKSSFTMDVYGMLLEGPDRDAADATAELIDR